jgi:hypothetical protein
MDGFNSRVSMQKSNHFAALIFILMYILCYINPVIAQENLCPELLKNEKDLHLVYEQSSLVFIAQITPRKGPNDAIYNYTTFDPILRGEVEPDGFITFDDTCYPKDNEAIYLFLLEDISEKIAGFNSAFLALPDGGPGFTWIAEWIESKVNGDPE